MPNSPHFTKYKALKNTVRTLKRLAVVSLTPLWPTLSILAVQRSCAMPPTSRAWCKTALSPFFFLLNLCIIIFRIYSKNRVGDIDHICINAMIKVSWTFIGLVCHVRNMSKCVWNTTQLTIVLFLCISLFNGIACWTQNRPAGIQKKNRLHHWFLLARPSGSWVMLVFEVTQATITDSGLSKASVQLATT